MMNVLAASASGFYDQTEAIRCNTGIHVRQGAIKGRFSAFGQ